MFTHSRAVSLLASVFADRYDPLDADLGRPNAPGGVGPGRRVAKDEAALEAADARVASLSALRCLHALATKLPAAAPKAVSDHPALVSLLVAAN
jgi:hypothetical protein